MTESIGVSVADHVATVELKRPPHNFFDEALLTELADVVTSFDDTADVRSIVLCSEGRNFCAGADLRGMGPDGIRRVYRQSARLFSGRKPIVAAVHGRAVGGGLGLAMAADFRVVAPDARLTANFAQLGFHQGFALSVTLSAAVGQQHAQDLLYTGRQVDGAEAVEIGLCDRLADDPRAGAAAYAAEIAASAPLAVPAIRATLRRQLVSETVAALDLEASAQASLLDTKDFEEGIAASIGKRPPNFTGA
ncbi:enoyl-CoA hydratase/isomerase family protein [Corynebacterium glyciniphilum]|uniref:enoyl-CoA hydratase/isomerase family protein n=1 Tax=Corynebacterium glyciniphilum TaxID=1404244 RepID=UPI003DA065C2